MSTEDAATRRDLPPAAAGASSPASHSPPQESTGSSSASVGGSFPSASTTGSSSSGNSSGTQSTETAPRNAAQPQQQAQPTASTGGVGNVPPHSPAAPVTIIDDPRLRLGRDPVTGRLVNLSPNPKPKPPAEPAKAQSIAPKETPKSSSGNDLEQAVPRERGIKGLDVIPKDWPKLPPNVSLGQEVSWVQANRLAVVKELPSGAVKVDLTKAYAPAPSMSTLFWLETAIKNPAKFVEVAAKQAGSSSDEAEFVRKERMAIGEIRSILGEMLDAKDG